MMARFLLSTVRDIALWIWQRGNEVQLKRAWEENDMRNERLLQANIGRKKEHEDALIAGYPYTSGQHVQIIREGTGRVTYFQAL